MADRPLSEAVSEAVTARGLLVATAFTVVCGSLLVGAALSLGVDLPGGERFGGEWLVSPSLTLNETETERLVYEQINERRVANGLEPLVWQSGLHAAAHNHSRDMRERDFFAHENPDGVSPATRIGRAGVDCLVTGENIVEMARNNHEDRLAGDIVEAWMDSSGHRENLLSSTWTRTGVGVVADDEAVYVTQTFCLRLPDST